MLTLLTAMVTQKPMYNEDSYDAFVVWDIIRNSTIWIERKETIGKVYI